MQRKRLSIEDIKAVPFVDENEKLFSAHDRNRENIEQYIAETFLRPDDCILELGARYGTVSCIANNALSNPFNHFAVEPDKRVIPALNVNRGTHNSYFFIFDGVISKEKKYSLTNLNHCQGYGTSSVLNQYSKIPILSLEDAQKFVMTPFTCLIADCEGFLETFLDENPEFIKQLRMVTFETDGDCDYDKIKKNLVDNGFEMTYEWNKTHFVYEKKKWNELK